MFVHRQRMFNSISCLVWLLVLSVIILMTNGQMQHNSRTTFLRSMSQVRYATTSRPLRLEAEEVDRISADFESRPSLTIQPEDRLKLRQSVMDLNKRRRVTAIRPTMSPDVISTPNVYHFFSKKRFERVRTNLTVTTSQSPTSSTTEAAPSADEMAA